MKVLLNESGFVENYAVIGELVDGVDAAEPEDITHFMEHFSAYRLSDGGLSFCPEEDDAHHLAEEKAEIRARRERECFSVINRGTLWYERLTDAQRQELSNWYAAWLRAPDTLQIPEKPPFI